MLNKPSTKFAWHFRVMPPLPNNFQRIRHECSSVIYLTHIIDTYYPVWLHRERFISQFHNQLVWLNVQICWIYASLVGKSITIGLMKRKPIVIQWKNNELRASLLVVPSRSLNGQLPSWTSTKFNERLFLAFMGLELQNSIFLMPSRDAEAYCTIANRQNSNSQFFIRECSLSFCSPSKWKVFAILKT